jgi:5-methylcytosine-specific restriction endonuclease McrA
MNHRLIRWAEKVLRRDDWTCQNCGANTCLDAAHIQSRQQRPDLATDVNNGVTLCRSCHAFYHQFPARFRCFVASWQQSQPSVARLEVDAM